MWHGKVNMKMNKKSSWNNLETIQIACQMGSEWIINDHIMVA